jgi:hypothetical protein
MIKYPCGLIEDLIPLYIEGDVSDVTKQIIEKHLKDCKDCSALVQQYSNDQFKLEDFKEDLPQADTFKKWMNRLKIWGIMAVASLIFIVTAIGTIGYKIGEKPKNDLLSPKTIVRAFEKQGVSLKEDKSKSPDDYALNGVKPVVFGLGEKKDTLLIYTFKSFVERDDIVSEANRFNSQYSLLQYSFKAKNTFLVYIASQTPTTEEEMKSIGETITSISDIVFKDLNDGKEIVYKGQSASWEGAFTIKYYENWWQDEKGTLHVDNYHKSYPDIKYKMSDIEAVGTIEFEYKTIGGSGGASTGVKLKKDGSAQLGSSGGSGAIPRAEDDINFNIKWNGKEENIVLKAK